MNGEENQGQMVGAVNLKEVKEIKDISIRQDSVLIQSIVPVNSNILLPNGGIKETGVTTLEVIKIGDKVDNIKVGDIIIDFVDTNRVSFLYKGDNNYILSDKYNISLWTDKENYDIV